MNPILDYYNALAGNYDTNRFGNSYGQFIDRQERQVLDRLVKRDKLSKGKFEANRFLAEPTIFGVRN
ncbi:hypothetical protein OGH69_16080 [Flavobacterium sp. MFBS3-15]|uniref:hypothetical protein n=1 Tax=Flavobacterium sp. MFBS3-15 TaxID=2989816 RepID=UPI0022360FE9|nr:hypothetical protein [Flavobacterium sp. MFBS3-15]MCW4470491.1 hypothetical protein [Flavobacterium sp. MFBS3-15]